MDKFAELLTNLSSVVGMQVERLWPQVVYLYWLRAIIDLGLVSASSVLVCGLSFYLLRRGVQRRNGDNEDFFIVFGALTGLAAMFIVVALLISAPDLIGRIVAPEASFVLNKLPR